MEQSSRMADYRDLLKGGSSLHSSRLSDNNSNENNNEKQQQAGSFEVRSYGLSTKEALLRLHEDMKQEVIQMKTEFSKRKFISWLRDSISFKSELSKMRWPSVLFMTAQAIAHFIVAFVLDVDNLATGWVGFQGFILTALLLFSLAVNLWDTELRFKELLMKSEQILNLIQQCSQDKHLLRQWRQYNWHSAQARSLFIPKSPCAHQTLTYRDESCLNLPDYLLVRGDIIHLYPGERAPSDCVSVKKGSEFEGTDDENYVEIFLQEGQIYHTKQSKNNDEKELVTNKFGSNSEQLLQANRKGKATIQSSHARLKKANKGTDFLILSTPYLKSLRISLQRSHKRPVNSVEKECFIISRKYFETFVIPSVFIMSTIVTAIHYGYLDLTDSDQKIKTISIAYLLLRPSLTIMPFLPWMFPCFWLAVNAYGSAKILCCGEAQREVSNSDPTNRGINPGYSPEWAQKIAGVAGAAGAPSKFENLLATPTAAGSSENKHDEDDLHDLRSNIKFTTIFKVFISLVLGKSGHVWRSSSLLQVLGCLTSLCCIDKVGILSWSNPTPEKLFVLTKNQNANDQSQFIVTQRNEHSDETASQTQADEGSNQQNLMTINSDVLNSGLLTVFNEDQNSSNQTSVKITKHSNVSQSRPEVLDISQTLNCYRGFSSLEPITLKQLSRLQFDDLNWKKYTSNLKPLGLAILMNNCCEKSFGNYFRFYKHISYESILRCNLTPVVKRRCICGLSKLIGFSKDATDNYKYVNQIGIYKLIDLQSMKRGKLASLESSTRLKLPFPNMICNIHRDISTGSHQVFSQGTADIILDACVEYWDGEQLMPLDEVSKKKIMDFYHRTSLTSYCSAFSYTPLLKGYNLGDRYIEFPPESSKFAPHLRKLASEHQEEFLQNQLINLPSRDIELGQKCEIYQSNRPIVQVNNLSDPSVINSDILVNEHSFSKRGNQITRRHLSVEDLRDLVDSKEPPIDARRKKSVKHRKLDDTLEELTDQVFVGMIAMQYQAFPDYVALVEQLEHACIRFVHFSKENELRSRVFSEKMGLESGWNCHISLQSDEDYDNAYKNDPPIDMSTSVNGEKGYEDGGRLEELKAFSPSARISNILKGGYSSEKSLGNNDATSCTKSISSDEQTLYSWKSLPSLVMRLASNLSSSHHHNHHHHQHISTPDDSSRGLKVTVQPNQASDSSGDNLAPESEFDGDEIANDRDAEFDGDSTRDKGFESLAFDMSNRAKLPKGIENIRPHLETVDNVPLQVSLFTDCTPDLTHQMIEIMQEYGEIVCVIGSASSKLNTPIFLQANASIAIEPMLPQCCIQSDNRPHKSLNRKRKKRAAEKLENVKRHHKSKKSKNEDEVEFTALQMNPRPNNPRDRLGIGTIDPSKPVRGIKVQRQVSTSSSSSPSSLSSPSQSSSPSSSYSSSPPESESEFEDAITTDDDLLNPNESRQSKSTSELARLLPGPNSLATKLVSLPCSYSYSRNDHVNLYGLIMEARHFTFKMKNTFVCMICFALSISSAQFLASILFLPPMLSSGLTIWLTVVVVPLMSFSLMSTTIDSQVMKIAVGKNLQLKPENITFFVLCYLLKFIPSIIVVVLNFGLIIAHSCKLTGFGSSSLGPCWMFTYVQHGNATTSETGDEDLLWSAHLLTAQVCAAFLMVLYFVVISAEFVHRSHLMWQRSPTRNHFWVIISILLIFGQLLYNQLVLQVNLSSSRIPYEFLASLPLHIWVISFMWPFLVIAINLLVKRAEIKATIRQQRRARFDFNTKLGMNSPF